MPGSLFDSSYNGGCKSQRDLDLALVAPDHAPSRHEQLLWVEAVGDGEGLLGQSRLIDPFDFQGAQGATQVVKADHVAGVSNARWLDEVGGKGALGCFVFAVRPIA